ncbi:hypothetical protein [Hydrogenimonas cancrithermarum]|uniref:hypothetical protein n=1 Tax=Hydrogenimonas cancrithermarum TaxID=2993563 RepID=UPI002573B792|nr:hypothetical protein [Hydrogenimonas cancrithermarum]
MRRSLATLASNFSFQNSTRDLGIAALYFGRTMSGDPGSFLTLRRYRKPLAKSAFYSFVSGPVAFCLAFDMIFERVEGIHHSTFRTTFVVTSAASGIF